LRNSFHKQALGDSWDGFPKYLPIWVEYRGKNSGTNRVGERLIGMTRTINFRRSIRLHRCGPARRTLWPRLTPRRGRIRIVFKRAQAWFPAIRYSSHGRR
jgi:hypothetical protein